MEHEKEKKKKSLKKYASRPSPPCSAMDFKGKKKRGNDGNWWISTGNSKEIYSWRKYESKGGSKSLKKKKTEKKKKTGKSTKSTKSAKSAKSAKITKSTKSLKKK
jgi:hypothetical protein